MEVLVQEMEFQLDQLKARWKNEKHRGWIYQQLLQRANYSGICEKEREYNLVIHRTAPKHYDGRREDAILIEACLEDY